MTLQASPLALTRTLQNLVEATLPLVHTIAERRQQRAQGVTYEELVEVGYEVLVEMAPQHDPARGAFDAFVALRVHGAMLDCIRDRLKGRRRSDLSSLSIPSPVREVPVEEAMRVSSGSDVADVLESVEIAIVGPVATYVGGTNANWVEDETVDRVQRDQVARAIHAFADALAETEKTIFKEHFLAGVRVADVAAKLSISVRTVERMLKALRERLREHLLRNVLA